MAGSAVPHKPKGGPREEQEAEEDALRAAMLALCERGGTSPWSVCTGPVHHLEIGSGPPVVLVHGAGGGAANWYRMFGPLSGTHRVLAPDLPGFGLTDATPLDPPLGVQGAKFLREWLDALGIDKASIIGTSFGGLAALRFAQHNPARVEKLVLIDTAGAGSEVSGVVQAARIPLIANLLLRPSRRGTRSLLRSLLLTARIDVEDEDALVEYLYWSARRSGAAYMVHALRHFAGRAGQRETLTAAELADVKVETLVVWGERDRFFPPRHAKLLADALPNATSVMILEAGHSPNWEKPQNLAAELMKFLNRNS